MNAAFIPVRPILVLRMNDPLNSTIEAPAEGTSHKGHLLDANKPSARTIQGRERMGLPNSPTVDLAGPASLGRYSAKRTRHRVQFFCDAPKAGSVRLVGDFNSWDLAATPMHRTNDGRWMATLEVPHGHHRYLFVVDGCPRLDPNAIGIARDDLDRPASLMAVS